MRSHLKYDHSPTIKTMHHQNRPSEPEQEQVTTLLTPLSLARAVYINTNSVGMVGDMLREKFPEMSLIEIKDISFMAKEQITERL